LGQRLEQSQIEMVSKLARFAVRFVIAAAILWAVISAIDLIAPLPQRDAQLIVLLRVPIAVFIFIVYIGKTLYDTFFDERH
jgi:membrane protease YdiL (CAAX protease family)